MTFFLLGGVALLLSLVLALAYATSRRRIAVVAAVGPAAVAAWLVVIGATAPARPYHDEVDYWGVWIDPVMFVVLGANLVAWLAGTAAGAALRRVAPVQHEPRLRSS